MHHALRPVAVAVLASVLMTAVVSVPAGVSAGSGGVAQASTTTTTQPATGPTRVECDAAEGDLVPLCQAYDHITTNYVDTLTEQQLASLASRAAAYVRNAGLTARTDGMPPPCPLPTADFEQVCVQIDAVDDTAAAVWEAIKGMVKILDSNSSLWTNETYERFMEWVDNKQTGIGIGLALMAGDVACEEVSSTCRPVIIDVYPGSPAETGGLMEGDVLVELNGPLSSSLSCRHIPGMDSFTGDQTVAVKVLSLNPPMGLRGGGRGWWAGWFRWCLGWFSSVIGVV